MVVPPLFGNTPPPAKPVMPQLRPDTWLELFATGSTHWAVGALAYQIVYGAWTLLGWSLKDWLPVVGRPVKKLNPLWFLVPAACLFIDDVGTGVGMQAEEFPRESYEGNPALVNWSHKGQEWGFFRNHTDMMRWHFISGAVMYVFLYLDYLTMNNATWFGMFLLIPLLKTYAGHGWWSIKPNNFTVSDFFTFEEGRDCWERSSNYAVYWFNKGTAPDKFAASEYATYRKNIFEEHPLDVSERRRLVEGSRTFRMLDELGWLGWYGKAI